jgi:iron complex outermembrane receptor protein
VSRASRPAAAVLGPLAAALASAAAFVGALGGPAPAAAQFGARARVEPPIAAGSDVDPTSSATTVDLDERPRALETLDEVLLQVPGARRRRTGGFGGFTSLSLRGAEAEHTTVVIGDVPLASADGTAFDLSTAPPWLFDRVEVFRGGAPVWLGAGGIGGVLRLVPRAAEGTHAEAVGAGGSFDLAQGRAGVGVGGRDVSWLAVAGLTHSGGRYPIAEDRMPLAPGSTERVQSNAQLLEAAGLVHARIRAGGGTMSFVGLGLERTGGLPPPEGRWTDRSIARRTHTRLLVAAAGEWLEGGRPASQADLAPWRLQVALSIGFDRRSTSDPRAEHGQVPRSTDERLARVQLRAAGTFRIAEWIDATAVALGWHDSFDPRDSLAGRTPRGSTRAGGALAIESRIHGREGDLRWELRPSGRFEAFEARLHEIRPESAGDEVSAVHAMPGARLGGVVEIVPGIAIQASGGTAIRAPSLVELFGDGGFLLGNARLSPEQATSVDGGAVVRGTAGPFRGFAELRGFGLFFSGLIRYRRNAQSQVVPENVASAWAAGMEASAQIEIERWGSLAGSFTWVETRDESSAYRGNQLTFRPRTTGYARPALHLEGLGPIDRATAYVEVDWIDGAFDDPANLTPIPPAAHVGVGVSFEALERRLRLDLTVRDVFDARGVDFTGRALPGRSVALQLAVRTN